jgi:hypothetical protein
MTGSTMRVLAALCVAAAVSACAAKPRERPLPIGDVAAGPNTVEAVRKQIQGSWVMTSLEVTAVDGRKAALDAAGSMTFDAFGNMAIEYKLSDAAQKALQGLGINQPTPVISTTGSVAINPVTREVTYMGETDTQRALNFDRELAERRANPFALERKRYYELGADGTMTLNTHYDDGKTAATSKWRKGV